MVGVREGGKFYYTTGLRSLWIQNFLYTLDERAGAEGLRQKRAATEEVVGPQGIAGVPGDEEHARLRRPRAYPLRQLRTVEVWQNHVGHEKVDRLCRLQVQGLFGARGSSNVEAGASQRRRNQLPYGPLVVDYQDCPWSHKEDIIVLYRTLLTQL